MFDSIRLDLVGVQVERNWNYWCSHFGLKARGAVGILSTYLEHFEVGTTHRCGI